MRIEDGFQPVPFSEGNPYTSDHVLPSLLKRLLPDSAFDEIEVDLVRFGNEIITQIRPLAGRTGPPQLTQYDQWGKRIDHLHTSEGWRAVQEFAQREGLPGVFYERRYKETSRIYGFAKTLLLMGDGHVMFCPTSMTDGAARIIELLGTPTMKRDIFPRLISRDPSVVFTSGQWMTERPGGSDVSMTETTAVLAKENHPFGPQYKLNGFKWFSSAIDGDMAVALARTGSPQDGSRGLSLFLVPLRLPLIREPSAPRPSLLSNSIYLHRLKDKIGTHAVPTAELSLESTEAYLIGPLNQGVKCITPVLNITRVYSAVASIGYIRKCLAIATSYANVRAIQGGTRLLKDTPLHVAQLASVSMVYRALVHLTFGVIKLLGKAECGESSAEEDGRLRLLTPVMKGFAAEKACAAMEEAMTLLGGAGYMEENGIGRVIRDGLVEKIWEGTTTVLSLDFVRAGRDKATLNAFISWGQGIISSCPPTLKAQIQKQLTILQTALVGLAAIFTGDMPSLAPRPALLLMGHTASSLYLLEHAIWSYYKNAQSSVDIEVFRRWVAEGGLTGAIDELKRAKEATEQRELENSAIVFGGAIKTRL